MDPAQKGQPGNGAAVRSPPENGVRVEGHIGAVAESGLSAGSVS